MQCFLLCIVTQALSAAPLPWLPFNEADSRESMLRLAEQENLGWASEFSHIIFLEQNNNTELAIQGYEQLITDQSTDAFALALLIPLYWRLMESQDAFEQRADFFLGLSDTAETGPAFQCLLLLEQLLNFHARLELNKPHEIDYAVENPGIRVQSVYKQLLSLSHHSPFPLNHWVASLLYLHMPQGGLAAADYYLLESIESLQPVESLQETGSGEQVILTGLLTVYRKILFELHDQELPEFWDTGSWLLPGARGDMTTQEMGERQHWAYKRFQGRAASTISSAWQSLRITVDCFYKAHSNPQVFRFRICLMPLNAARQSIDILNDLLYKGVNAKRRAPWRDMWEWNAGDSEYELLVSELSEVAGFKERVASSLQQDFSHQLSQVNSISDPQVREAQRLNLYQSHLTDFASQHSVQNAIDHSNQRLQQIQTIKTQNSALQQAFERFKERQQTLTAQIQHSPHNEALIAQYLSLIDGQDARTGLTEQSRLNLRATVVKWLDV